MPEKLQTHRRSKAHGRNGFLLLVLFGSLAMGTMQVIARRASRPDVGQAIAATLVSWGMSLDGIKMAVDAAAVEDQIARLRSPISEARVQAADWLASHGIRSSAGDIARAMDDPGTRRPCQLAKSLGSLGDDRWADKLILATRQRGNVDLQICATLALGELQSPRAVSALIEVYHSDVAPTLALDALGRIADPSALQFLGAVVASPRNEGERALAAQAIQRVFVMNHPDPAAALIDRLQQQAAQGSIPRWAVRKLATLRDPRAVPVMRDMFVGADHREQVWLTASLLAHGQPGRSALRGLAETPASDLADGSTRAVARAGLSLADTVSMGVYPRQGGGM